MREVILSYNNKTLVLHVVVSPICVLIFFVIDLLRIPPGFKSGMDFTDKGKIKDIYIKPIIVELNGNLFICFIYAEAKVAKAEVNLMSLLSTLDDITEFRYEEEQQEAKESNNTPKVPRTNSLEDLGIKVLRPVDCDCMVRSSNL